MKKYVFDTNCFINATNCDALSYVAVNKLLELANNGVIFVGVSQHSIEELAVKKDEAWKLAKNYFLVKNWPIGTWENQVSTWDQIEGTWAEAERIDRIQNEIEKLAKSGNDIRDRGAFIDALFAGFHGFVTSDKQFIGSGPAKRFNDRFSISVTSPEDLILAIVP